MPHPPPTAGILAGPLPAPFLLLLSARAGAAVSGLARSPCHASRGCPCRSPCSGPVAVDLFLSFLTKSSLLCCICSYSCYSTRNPSGPPPRNRPCCASCFCSVLGTGRPQPCRQIAQDSSTPPGPPVGLWHGDSHPGATIQMALRPRYALLWGAPPDIVGRRYHPFAGGTRPNRRGYLLPGA